MISTARAGVEAVQPVMSRANLAECTGISNLLRSTAELWPHDKAFVDQAQREDWSDRPAASLTFQAAHETAERLAGFFVSLGLPAKALVGICLPNCSEAPLVLVALERAGLTACLLSVAWPRETLSAIVEDLGIACVVTQSRIGPLRPAETWREIAAGYFGLRFVLAFGPSVPDGVGDLDSMVLENAMHAGTLSDREDGGGFVSFDFRNGVPQPIYRSWRSAIAAARVFLTTARYEHGDRLLSFLAQDDHRSLTTGLVAALAVGASVEFHGLFSSAAFARSLAGDGAARIVAPGWMEADLARLNLGPSVSGVILVHQAPVRFKARAPLTLGVVDALAFGEMAVLAKSRNARGQFSLSLDAPPVEDAASQSQLLDVRRDEDGQILFNGLAAQTSEVGRQGIGEAPNGWRASGYRADLFAGIVIGVS